MQDYAKLYESRIRKETPEERLERVGKLIRRGLPHAMVIALIMVITKR